MLTDTAMFRNPNYHTHHDTHDTLDFDFMANVAKSGGLHRNCRGCFSARNRKINAWTLR
jgi:hypothetical protein